MDVPRALHHLARPQDGLPVGLMVGEAQGRAVQAGHLDLFLSQLFPRTVILLRRPERMLRRQMQAQEGLAQPERGLRAGVSLHQRRELPVEAQSGHPLVEEVLPAQELHQGSRGNPPGPPGIGFPPGHHQVPIKGAGGGVAVYVASPPHVRPAVPVEEVPVGLHQLIGILFKPSGDVRFILISVPQVPDRPIYIEGPAGIIVKGVPVPIPAVPGIVGQDGLGMVAHDVPLDGIPLHMQERHVQHVEQPPVLGHGAGVGIAVQKRRDHVLLRLRIGVPNLPFADPQADHQSAGLHGLLESLERIPVSRDPLLIFIGAHIERIPLGAHPQDLIFIIFRARIPAYPQIRYIGHHRGRDEEGARQPLEHLRSALDGLGLPGIL